MTGADSNLRGELSRTALLLAALDGHHEAAISLFKGSPVVDVEAKDAAGDTPLVIAAKQGKIDFVRCLMDYRPGLAAPSQQLQEAASWAANNGHFETVEFLIQQR
jgi:ankyrin repeat protein